MVTGSEVFIDDYHKNLNIEITTNEDGTLKTIDDILEVIAAKQEEIDEYERKTDAYQRRYPSGWEPSENWRRNYELTHNLDAYK